MSEHLGNGNSVDAGLEGSARRPMRREAAAFGWLAIASGLVVLVGGWCFGFEFLKNIVPGTIAMKASTASALILLGASLLLLLEPEGKPRRRRVGIACAVGGGMIGLAFLSEYVLNRNLGIDELPFRDGAGRAAGVPHPGRLAPTTAVSLVLVGVALATLDRRQSRSWRPSELLVMPVALIATMSLIGYLYAIPAFYGPASAAKMALTTACCFLALAVAIAIARPHGRLLGFVTTSAPGGILARRLMPLVVLLPLVLGWLRVRAGDAGFLGGSAGDWWLTAATIVAFLVVLWRVATRMNTLDGARQKLERELFTFANHDELTGLFNRRRFREEASGHARRTLRRGGSTALIILDLDGLKSINDSLGHLAGDDLIEKVGRSINATVRKTDVAARLGGDEFAVLLPDSTEDGATRVAENLRRAVRDIEVKAGLDTAHSTASVGVAHSVEPLTDDGRKLLGAADQAMYEAKRSGGDLVAIHHEAPESEDLASSIRVAPHAPHAESNGPAKTSTPTLDVRPPAASSEAAAGEGRPMVVRAAVRPDHAVARLRHTHSRWLVAAATVLGALFVTQVLATQTGLWDDGNASLIQTYSYMALMLGAVALIVVRVVLIPSDRVAWGLLAAGLAAWTAGDIYYAAFVSDTSPIPYPSLSDGLYLMMYVALLGGLRALGGRVDGTGTSTLNLMVCLLGLASVWSWLAFDGVIVAATGDRAAVATTAAYPVLDLLLVAAALVAAAARSWRIEPAFATIFLGLLILAGVDLAYAAQVSQGTFVDGSILDALWPMGALAIAAAAWSPQGRPPKGISGDRLVPALTGAAAVVAVALLVRDHFEPVDGTTIVLAAATLAAAVAQLLFLFHEAQTARRSAEDAESLRSASAEAALDCIVSIDAHDVVQEWNQAAQGTFGYSREEALGRKLADLIVPAEFRDRHIRGVEALRLTGDSPMLGRRMEVMAAHARGGSFPIELTVTRIQKDPPMFTAYVRDITESRRRKEENERLAAIVRSSEDAILSKDLSGVVTAWNHGAENIYGYSAEEAVGRRIVDLIIPPDRTDEVEAITKQILRGSPVALNTQRRSKTGEMLEVSLRAFPIRGLSGAINGVSVSSHDKTDRRRLEALDRESEERKLWRRRIEEALAHDRFDFWAQPIVDVSTGEVDHHELLLRMKLGDKIITPFEFLSHAESSSLITEIDRWVITQGIALARTARVALNLSAKGLLMPGLIEFVRQTLREAETPASNVLFEVTETAAVENLEAARQLVEELRALGCGVALDDFGTGYGSFTYLKALPVTELKVDMSFVRTLLQDDADQRIVESIIHVARNFGMKTVAEGVEDEATLALLVEMGVDLVQGYQLGRPRPLAMTADPFPAAFAFASQPPSGRVERS